MHILFYNRDMFLQITKVMANMGKLFIFFLHLLLLDLQGNATIIKSL